MGNLHGCKAKNMSDIIKTIKKMDSGYIIGRITDFLSDFGNVESKME
jgi:hypothetical protein